MNFLLKITDFEGENFEIIYWDYYSLNTGLEASMNNPKGFTVEEAGTTEGFPLVRLSTTTNDAQGEFEFNIIGIGRYLCGYYFVCMATKITVVETYRDENVYRLTCTATPQGGTAPYTFDWSSGINGSQALTATNQATLEVEIPAIGVGTISVDVSDSSDPACTASASFDVCGNVNCDFTTSLISTPPNGDTGPYIYECVSSSIGVGDLVHEWSPEPIEVSADGKVAKFSFPDDDEHSIDLTVKDASGCHGFKTHKVGGYEFTISTDPSGEDTGTITGTRDTMEFTVTVKAQATGNFTAPPPAQLTFEFLRPATNEVSTAVAPLVAGSSPPRYEFPWLVRQAKGRWQIKVQGYKSNTVTFKIDKRKQIVEVANSWVGGTQAMLGSPSANCNDLSAIVYNHLGLPLGGSTDAQSTAASLPCSGNGCLLFFNIVEGPPNGPYTPRNPWNASHVAIEAGGQRININSATSGPTTVTQEAVDAGVNTTPPWYDPDIHARSTVDLDED